MHIDELLALTRSHISQPDNQPHLTLGKDWSQGRTTFGGISAAIAYEAIKQKVDSDRVMRSFTCNFIGPIAPDTPFQIEVDVLRQGKNVSQVMARIIQDDQISLLCQACFGVERKSKIRIENSDKHSMAQPKKAKFIPQIPKVTPKFLRHYDLSVDAGGMPFTGSKVHHVHGWMRFKQQPEVISDAHLIALIDAWPPTVIQMLKWPAPASTMSWNVEFIHPHSEFSPTDWFAYQASTRQAADGYAHTEANIWDQQGELVAVSRQAVAVFD